MKLLIPFFVLLIAIPTPIQSQDMNTSTSSVDQLVSALYEVISGPAGQRDWDRMKSLFHPNAIMGAMRKSPEGQLIYSNFTVDQYIERNGSYFLENGFFETETGSTTDSFGELQHRFSAYSSKRTADGPIFARGINSIQCVFEKGRWWIVSIQWNTEREDLMIPKKLRNSKRK